MSRNQSNRRPSPAFKKPFCKVCCDAGKSEKEYTSHFVKDRGGDVICPTLLSQECRYCFQPGHTVKFCAVLKKREQEKEQYAKECARAERVKIAEEKKPAPAPVANSRGGAFAALADDSDSDEGSPRAQKEQKEAEAYKKGQAYFEHVDLALTMEFPGAARFCRANGLSIGAVMLNTKQEKPKPKTQEEEFPTLSSNVTLRPHQKSFADEGASFAAKLAAPKPQPKAAVQPKKVAVVSKRDAWSDDEDSTPAVAAVAAAPFPFKSFTFKKITNWAECESSDDEDEEPYFSDGDSYRNR
jgi:hypothetical protein